MQNSKENPKAIVSLRMADGTCVEIIYKEEIGRTQLCIYRKGEWRIVDSLEHKDGTVYVPMSPHLPSLGVIHLAEEPKDYASIESLVQEIRAYIHRYVDLLPEFELLATYYILFTWVYDAFSELGYVRFIGDLGSGKTRALNIIGSLCFRAIFASGATTVSPIFWFLDEWKGTLIFDETDFRSSDMTADMTKLFNNGTTKGFPILRQQVSKTGVMSPRAFSVFGPKVVSMRSTFDDQALESRFFTSVMGMRKVREDVPINLPDEARQESKALRNKLLMYRFHYIDKVKADPALITPSASGRTNQILVPLLSVIPNEEHRATVCNLVTELDGKQLLRRQASIEGELIEVILSLFDEVEGDCLRIADITSAFFRRYGSDHDRPITNRYIGEVLRSKLHLFTYKKSGVYVLPVSESEKMVELAGRYGIAKNNH